MEDGAGGENQSLPPSRQFLKSRASLTSSAKTKEEKPRQVFLTVCVHPLPKRVHLAAFYERI